MSALPGIDDPASITTEWCAPLAAPGAGDVVAVDVQTLGDVPGYFSRMYRIVMTYDDGSTESLVAKMASAEAWNRMVGFTLRCYETEYRFYEELSAKLPVRVPGYRGGALDINAQQAVLVMEDLSGSRVGNQSDGCDEREAAAAIDELVTMHAAWWESPELDRLEWLLTPTTNADGVALGYEMACDGFLSTYGDRVSPEVKGAVEGLRGRVPELLGMLATGPNTLVHGDFRLDNLAFDHGDDPRPLIFDWQGVMRSNGLFDVAELLSLGLPTDQRRECEQRLLRRYLAKLAEHGIEVSYDDAFEMYRLGALFTLSIGVSQTMTATEQHGSDTGIWIDRTSAAVADLGVPPAFR